MCENYSTCPLELWQPSWNPEAKQPQEEVTCKESRLERQKENEETGSLETSLDDGHHLSHWIKPYLKSPTFLII